MYEYAIRMIEYHTRLLKKWISVVEKYNKKEKKVKQIEGQMTIFDLEE